MLEWQATQRERLRSEGVAPSEATPLPAASERVVTAMAIERQRRETEQRMMAARHGMARQERRWEEMAAAGPAAGVARHVEHVGARVRAVAGDAIGEEQLEEVAWRLMREARAEQRAGAPAEDGAEAAREAAAESVGGVGGWADAAACELMRECVIRFRSRVIRVMAEITQEAAMASEIAAG